MSRSACTGRAWSSISPATPPSRLSGARSPRPRPCRPAAPSAQGAAPGPGAGGQPALRPDAAGGASRDQAGAAATRAIDIAHERRRDAAEAEANRHRDLDETRRLLYMALVLGRARQHQGAELVATIVNALVHHQSAVAVDEAVAHVAAVLRGDMGARVNAGWKHRSSGSRRNSTTGDTRIEVGLVL